MDSYNDLLDALKDVVNDCNWQNIGNESLFQQMKCYKLYCVDEIDQDIVLVRSKKNRFFAVDSRCSHEGGPLEEGDIEELGEKLIIVCPWHMFDFDLSTGVSSTGLKQQAYEVRVVNNEVYVNTSSMLSLKKPADDAVKQEAAAIAQLKLNDDDSGDNSEASLNYWAVKILCTADPFKKVELTMSVAEKWKNSELKVNLGNFKPPDQPYRQQDLTVLDPGKIKRGKGGTLASRIALLHSLANIEQWAIDLSWDIIARFSSLQYPDKTNLPNEFYDDFIKVACDEAKHFTILEKRLKELNSHFGALPIHNGLWESATVTKDNFLARLAVLHMVHEARGLDVHPQTRVRFQNQNDNESVRILDILYNDEVTHVAAGLKWFQYSCEKHNYPAMETFHTLVKEFFKGYLKPPFDTNGRTIAGMNAEWYMPLIKPKNQTVERE